MKFTITTGVLQQALELLKRIIPSRSAMPIYEDVHVTADENGTLTLTGSDSENSLVVVIPADSVEQGGACCFDFRLMSNLLKEMPELPLNFELQTTSNSSLLTVEWFGGHTEMPAFDSNDYPKIARISEESKNISIDMQAVAPLLRKIRFAVGHDEARPILNGIRFDISPEGTTLVATDARILILTTLPETKGTADTSFILPSDCITSVLECFGDHAGELEFKTDGNYLEITSETATLCCRLPNGKFPNYASVLPKNTAMSLVADRKQLLTAIKVLQVFSERNKNLVTMKLDEKGLSLKAEDALFGLKASENPFGKYEGEPMELNFKADYIISLLNAMESDEVRFGLTGARASVKITPENNPEEKLTAVLMPVLK